MKRQYGSQLDDFKHNEEDEYESDRNSVGEIQQLIDTIKCVDAFDEPSSRESGEDVYLMRILMQIWGLCGCSAEDLMEYVPKKTSARKSSTVHMSSAHLCSVNLCGLTKIECIYLLSCMAICHLR